MIRSGCGAFPVGHARYFGALDTLEAGSPGCRLPRPETAARWRDEAPRGFVFSVLCDPAVTQNQFRRTREVTEAWERTLAVARALEAGFIVLETPPTFYAQADRLRDLYAFVRSADRAGAVLVWQPSRGWEAGVLRRVCQDLRLVHAVDPLVSDPVAGALNYFRLRGGGPGRKPSRGHRYSDAELRSIVERAGIKPTYAYFLNADMWEDSQRLAKLANPVLAIPARGRQPPGQWRRGS